MPYEPIPYKRWNTFKGALPPSAFDDNTVGPEDLEGQIVNIPVTESSTEQGKESEKGKAKGKEKDKNDMSDWTVYRMDVTSGSLGWSDRYEDHRTLMGWMADPRRQQPYRRQSFSKKDTENEESTPIASTPAALHFPHPALSLPPPGLELDFRMSVTLNPRVSVGATPLGHRNWISFTGGSWSGSFGSGTVMPGGQDSQIIVADGSAKLETNYLLQTIDEDPAYIVIKTHGWRTGEPDVLEALADPTRADTIDPRMYKFRIFIEMDTGDERYREKVNYGMWVGSGMRKGTEVIYDAYRVT